MRVITLTPGSLEWQCGELAREIEADNPGGFDYMLGIRPGGARLAQMMAVAFAPGFIRHEGEVRIRRRLAPGNRGVMVGRKLLRQLPLWMLNAMRKGQQLMYRVSSALKIFHLPRVELPEGLTEANPQSLLIVDDAIDTGTTLLAVTRTLSEAFPRAKQRVVVITVTTANPLRHADYATYPGPGATPEGASASEPAADVEEQTESTLVRFPWSPDYKY